MNQSIRSTSLKDGTVRIGRVLVKPAWAMCWEMLS